MTGLTDKAKERKYGIMAAAQELFNEKGFQETSINDIMKKAGAAKGTFYYYFETKDQILDTLVSGEIGEIETAMTAVAVMKNLNALDKLKKILQAEFEVTIKRSGNKNHIHNIKNVDMHQRIMISMVEKLTPIIGGVVEQGVEEGVFEAEYPMEISEIINSGIHFITDLGIFNWSKEQYIRRVKASEELIEKALGLEHGSFGFLSEMLQSIPDKMQNICS